MPVKHLGQVTDETISNWVEQYEQRDEDFCCKKCGGQIKQGTCHISIHIKEFEPACVGSGKVVPINFPFCPKCDGDIEYATACCHIPMLLPSIRQLGKGGDVLGMRFSAQLEGLARFTLGPDKTQVSKKGR